MIIEYVTITFLKIYSNRLGANDLRLVGKVDISAVIIVF